jgi:hypothetical protein
MALQVEAPLTQANATQSRLREAVEALSRIERRATTEGERHSAEWVAEALRKAGAPEIRLTSYSGHSTWAIARAMGPG